MTKLVREFPMRVAARGRAHVVRAYGEKRPDGRWEGWLEFVDEATGDVVLTGRETTQADLLGLRYWANGLGRTYVEGACDRSLRRFGIPLAQRGPV